MTSSGLAPRVLAKAPAIPLPSAKGDVSIFFFGTLMDADVLAHVLDRRVANHDRVPGVLHGFRRCTAKNASYPLLVPEEGGRVAGLLLRGATAHDVRRINHFESEEYRAELHAIQVRHGTWMEAWVYLGLEEVMESTDEAWSLDVWVREHKDGFFALCDAWMSDFRDE